MTGYIRLSDGEFVMRTHDTTGKYVPTLQVRLIRKGDQRCFWRRADAPRCMAREVDAVKDNSSAVWPVPSGRIPRGRSCSVQPGHVIIFVARSANQRAQVSKRTYAIEGAQNT